MLKTALLAGKAVSIFRKREKRRAGIAGSVSLLLCPDLFSRLRTDGTMILITGSDGKSTVASMVAHILRAAGKKVVTTSDAATPFRGAASVLISAADLNGFIHCDYLVIEADERTPKEILSVAGCRLAVVTDLLESHGPLFCRGDAIRALLEKAVTPDTELLLNANDPRCVALYPEQKRSFFRAEDSLFFPRECINLVRDNSCPVCGGRLKYSYVLYHHVGKFACSRCGFATPEAEFRLENFSLATPVCTVDGADFSGDVPAVYQYMNILAAVAAVRRLTGVSPEECAGLFKGYRTPEVFFRSLHSESRRVVPVLCRVHNPVSYDRAFEYIAARPETKTVLIYLGNTRHRTVELGWLYEATFELIRDKAECFICAGERREDVAVRLQYAGVRAESIRVAENEAELHALADNPRGPLYVLAEEKDARRLERILRATKTEG